jgi:hypothetical protein
VVAAELVNEDCVRRLNEDPILSSSVHDGTLYLSASDADALVDVQAAFAKSLEGTARLNQSSCVLIKPHAVASGTYRSHSVYTHFAEYSHSPNSMLCFQVSLVPSLTPFWIRVS